MLSDSGAAVAVVVVRGHSAGGSEVGLLHNLTRKDSLIELYGVNPSQASTTFSILSVD
jgi:hypothetical protein